MDSTPKPRRADEFVMRLLLESELPAQRVRSTHGHSPFGAGFALALFALPLVLAGTNAAALADVFQRSSSWLLLALALPAALVAGLYSLVLATVWHGLRATLRDSNWVVKLADDGIYLKLRSYLNHAIVDATPNVVFIAHRDIARFRQVEETYERGTARQSERVRRSWIEFELTTEADDASALAVAIEDEAGLRAPERVFLGIRSRTHHGHAPVLVADLRRVRCERVGRALERELRRILVEDRELEFDLDLEGGPESLEERVRARLARGDELTALELVRVERGLTLLEARQALETLRSPSRRRAA